MLLALKSGCKYRLSLADRFDYMETIMNQLLADPCQNPTSKWQLTIKLHLVVGYKAISSSSQSVEILSSIKPVPGAKKVGNL